MRTSTQTLRATLDVPFECSFTKPGVMNGLPTYPVPPVPTIQGLIYAALGRPSLLRATTYGELDNKVRDREEEFRADVQETCSFGIRVLESGREHTNLRKRQQAPKSSHEQYQPDPVQREALMSPTYRVYAGGPTERLETFRDALSDPERLLFLGRSDDLVDIRDPELVSADYVDETARLDCVVPGVDDGDDPVLLPVEPDQRDGIRTVPGRVTTVSIEGGEVDGFYRTEDGERFVYIT